MVNCLLKLGPTHVHDLNQPPIGKGVYSLRENYKMLLNYQLVVLGLLGLMAFMAYWVS